MNAGRYVPVLIGLTVTGISAAYMLYLLLRKDEDDVGIHVPRIVTSRPTIIEVKIPQDIVGVVVGRDGSTVKEIEEKTNTKISLKDGSTDAHQVCVIKGNQEGAPLAENLIRSIIVNQPLIETFEMLLPQHVCARVIGRLGETVQSIARTSNAKVTVEACSIYNYEPFRRVIIKGTTEQIAVARSLIQEKVAECISIIEKIQESVDRRSPRKMGPQYLMSAEALEAQQAKQHNTECLLSVAKDGFLEVFVSAMEHPGRFWVQVIVPRAVELDHLLEEMTEYYRQEENRDCHALKEVKVDQLVAAPFSHDDNWYRARVTEVTLDDYDVEESLVALYYLDYGDSDTQRKKDLCSLSTNFLKLRYQAIECCLAKVKPVDERWTDEAIELFRDLCHVAEWRVLMSRVDSFKEREHGEREGSPVPVVELCDTNGVQDICVAEELVKQGYATWDWNTAESQQMNLGAKLGQHSTDSNEAASSSGTESNTVVGVTVGQDITESNNCSQSQVQNTGVQPPECHLDKCDNEGGLGWG